LNDQSYSQDIRLEEKFTMIRSVREAGEGLALTNRVVIEQEI
jgi:hypothetical protein